MDVDALPPPARDDVPRSTRRVTVLSGGVGGARFLQGLLHHLRDAATDAPVNAEVTVVANTADDIWLHGLKVCPDLDTVMYTLGGGIDAERGWGRTAETWHAKEELAAAQDEQAVDLASRKVELLCDD